MITITTKINRESIRRNLETESGAETLQYIQDALDSLRDIRNHKISWNPITMTIEMIATHKACEVLEQMFSFLNGLSRPVKKEREQIETFNPLRK